MAAIKEDISSALTYIENNLTEKLDIQEIAAKAYLSPFYFQRIFAAQCGVSVGEYIRYRRLSLAGELLSTKDVRIIDVASMFGYESPDSFNRAFQKFHGIIPSMARKKGACLQSYAPIKLKNNLKGGKMLEYRIVEKQQFTVVGVSQEFHPDTSYQEIPKFWDEAMETNGQKLMGIYGICLDLERNNGQFVYYIADNYLPWQEIPEGFEALVIPAHTWAVFPCRGPNPETMQDVNTRMWSEWLPNCKNYRLAGNLNVEVYGPPAEDPKDTYSEIWLPVEKM